MKIRIARPASDLRCSHTMYVHGLQLETLGQFQDHDGFDGVIIGRQDWQMHLEFTQRRSHRVSPSPSPEDLLVFYVDDKSEWRSTCIRMVDAGFQRIESFNPYWEVDGQTFVDPDGYRTVIYFSQVDAS